jgi:hypothetical protein
VKVYFRKEVICNPLPWKVSVVLVEFGSPSRGQTIAF